jgi:hypothetical protein
MIKVAAAFLLMFGSGLIFWALVEMDRPALGPRLLRRRAAGVTRQTEADAAPEIRRAA